MADDAPRKRRTRGVYEYPRGSGVWHARWADAHGRIHRKKVGPKALAQRVYARMKTEVAEHRFFPEQLNRRDVLLADAIAEYLARTEHRIRTYRDWARYAKYWTNAPETRGKAMRAVLPSDIERYVARRRREGMKPASCNRELTFLRCVYRSAMRDEHIGRSPVRPEHFAKEANQRVRWLRDDEETALRAAVGEAEWPKVAVALHTGFRQGNEFRLRWTDVNFESGVITARQSKSGEDYHVPMNDELRAILRALPSRLKSEWVFPSERGDTPLDAKNYVNRVFLPALKAAGVRDFHWHDLRHTFASRLVMRGADIRTVQELLGHKTLAMTMRYSHLSAGHKLEAVQRLTTARPSEPTDIATDIGVPSVAVLNTGTSEARDDVGENDGPCWTRTSDPLLKRQLLYLLS